MKKILFLLAMVGLLTSGVSSARLYDYYAEKGQNLPSVESRVSLAEQCGIQNYQGLAEQNIALEACLRGNVGASLPVVVALYEDSLASRLSSTATSTFTLVRGTDKQSRNLNGYYNFVIDEGTTVEEFFLATCSGTACTINTRGIDVVDGKTGTTSLQFEHRRGAVVKITNFPQLAILSRILQGLESTPGGLTFATNTFYVSSTLFGIRQNGLQLQWTTDGWVNSYNFTSSSISQLTASSTAGIGVLNSEIYVLVSSTLGMAFGPDGRLYQKTSSTLAVENDSNGIKINTSTLVGLIATSTATAGKIPISNVSGTLDIEWSPFGSYLFGDNLDGNIDITSNSFTSGTVIINNVLQRNLYANSLTLSAGNLNPNGYKIYANTLTISSTFYVSTTIADGGQSPDGDGAGTISPGSVTTGGTLNGGNLSCVTTTASIGVLVGTRSGDGGGSYSNPKGTGSSATNTMNSRISSLDTVQLFGTFVSGTFTRFSSGVPGCNGGNGSFNTNGNPGVGGVGGASGGIIAIYAKNIINNGTIAAKGGKGGTGGAGVNHGGNAGGGGGGSGGGGGVVGLMYKNYSGSGTIDVSGGFGGSPGGGNAVGSAGAAGPTGTIYMFKF